MHCLAPGTAAQASHACIAQFPGMQCDVTRQSLATAWRTGPSDIRLPRQQRFLVTRRLA